MSFTYLASPYTHPDPNVRKRRFHAAARAAARLMALGEVIFSPIVHGHALHGELPHDLMHRHDFWMQQCLPLLLASTRIKVLPLVGWERSNGISIEMQKAGDRFIPVEIISRKWIEAIGLGQA